MTKKEVEDELCRTLGAEKVIWIPGDINETGLSMPLGDRRDDDWF